MAITVEQLKTNKRVEDQTTTNEYPDHKTWVSRGGIRIEHGDKEGKEFYKMTMPSGTYYEIYPDGKIITYAVGDNKQYNKAGVTFSVDENNDLHVYGHNNIKIGGGAHIEVAGNAGIAVGGDTALVGIGNFNFDVQNCYMGVRGDFGMRVEGAAKFQIDGALDIKSGTSITETSPGHKIDTPMTTITHDIDHGGNMDTKGIHQDSIGLHA